MELLALLLIVSDTFQVIFNLNDRLYTRSPAQFFLYEGVIPAVVGLNIVKSSKI